MVFLEQDRKMDSVQQHDICTNVKSSQTLELINRFTPTCDARWSGTLIPNTSLKVAVQGPRMAHPLCMHAFIHSFIHSFIAAEDGRRICARF
jgi:hypothetical protein